MHAQQQIPQSKAILYTQEYSGETRHPNAEGNWTRVRGTGSSALNAVNTQWHKEPAQKAASKGQKLPSRLRLQNIDLCR